jgi:hypothetical protein
MDVQYMLGSNEEVRLELFNTLGEQVGVLWQGYQPEGLHAVHYMLNNLPEGSYYLRLSSRFSQTSTSVSIIR